MPMPIPTMYCWSPLSLLVLVGIFSFFYFLYHGLRGKEKGKISSGVVSKKKLPPGPKGFPILGCLPMLSRFPHVTFQKWAKQYGPIMYMKLGLIPTVVVSSPQAAQQFLKTHDLVFASRPISEIGRLISNYKGIGLTPYSTYWRNIRKICTLEFFSSVKNESFRLVRKEELGLLVGSLKEASEARGVVDLTTKVANLSRDMTNRMLMGKKYMEESLREGRFNFKEVIEESMYLSGAFNVADFIPWTRDLDLQGFGRRLRAVSHAFNVLFDRIIDDHIEDKDEKRERDFVDYMLSMMDSNDHELIQFDRSNMKAIMLDITVAATDTVNAATEWTLSELIKNPSAMKKAQQELETIVGKERMVDESDLVKLDYLDMVIKESMRLHTPIPLLLPHESMEDCTIDGFHIPNGSRILINAWAIGRDPDAWPKPDQFIPERFIGTNIDVRGRDFQLVPFGSGRRGCPGMQLGLIVVKFGVAQLIHCFDWELPNGMLPADLDMTDKAGFLAMPRAHPLLAVPTYRL